MKLAVPPFQDPASVFEQVSPLSPGAGDRVSLKVHLGGKDYYVRHQNFVVKLTEYSAADPQLALDATFYLRNGRQNPGPDMSELAHWRQSMLQDSF